MAEMRFIMFFIVTQMCILIPAIYRVSIVNVEGIWHIPLPT